MAQKLNISSGFCHPRNSDGSATAIRTCGCKFRSILPTTFPVCTQVQYPPKAANSNSALLELCQRRTGV